MIKAESGDDPAADVEMADSSMPASSQVTEKSPEDRFLLNGQFKSNQFRINLPIPSLEEDGTTTKRPKLVQDRAHTIDATIIKRMKTHKRMDMNELLTEVVSALSMF